MKLQVPLNRARPGKAGIIAALLLLAAPLALAAWGFGGYSAQRVRSNADARLTSSLNAASNAYGKLVSDANSMAAKQARGLKRSFLRGRSRALTWRMLPDGSLVPWHGAVPAAASVRTVDIISKGRTVGHVVVF